MIEEKNFAGMTKPPPPYDTETHFKRCNFSQPSSVPRAGKQVGVRLWPGDDTPRTFEDCNLFNCELPPGSTTLGLCNCHVVRRVIRTDTITIVGGPTITYEVPVRTWHGKRKPDGQYEYRNNPQPEDES